MNRWLALLALQALPHLTGCGPQPNLTPVAHQAEFSKLIWADVFNMPGAPPDVEWMHGESLNCDDGWGFWVYTRNGKECVGGSYNPKWGDWVRARITPDGSADLYAVAHEFLHVARERTIGDWEDHPAPDFGQDGILAAAERAIDQWVIMRHGN